MLNESQQELVNSIYGQIVAIACPGSGKTTAVVQRAVHMVEDEGIDPKSILIITFTQAAAVEMESRFNLLCNKKGITFGTIHSFCFRILSHYYGLNRKNILDSGDQYSFFQNLFYKRVMVDDFEDFISKIISEISYIRNNGIPYYTYEPKSCQQSVFIDAYEQYRDYKQSHNYVDFDDMLLLSRKCLVQDPEELQYWQDRYRFITVDEYQDTNRIQADIIYLLGGENGNLCFVGDDDQSIYKFRAADSSILLSVVEDFPDCKVINLDTNYRSLPDIIRYAGNLIGYNKKRFAKQFKANRQGTALVQVITYDGCKEEAEDILGRINTLHENGLPYNEMAVLYRTNSQNFILSGKMMEQVIPFYSSDPIKDIHESFVYKDIMAYARLAYGIGSTADFLQILNKPSRYISNAHKAAFETMKTPDKREIMLALQHISDDSAQMRIRKQIMLYFDHMKSLKDKPPEFFLQYLRKQMGYRDWLAEYAKYIQKDPDELQSIFDMIATEGSSYKSFKDWSRFVEKYTDNLQKLRREKKRDGVCLSTFHSAKGLEWNTVFIMDANEGYTPSKKAETEDEMEEERRMFYVAATRAKDNLFICESGGSPDMPTTPSRFINEMNVKDHIVITKIPDKTSSNRKERIYAVKSINGFVVNQKFSKWYGPGGCKEFVEGRDAIFKAFESDEEAEMFFASKNADHAK